MSSYLHSLRLDSESLEVKQNLKKNVEENFSVFNYEGFFYAVLMKIRREEYIKDVPVKRLLAKLLEFRARNPEFFIKRLNVEDVKNFIINSQSMYLIEDKFVQVNLTYRITEKVRGGK